MSTNEKLNAVLEHGLRERLAVNPKEVETRSRLAHLYGYSVNSAVVKERAQALHVGARPKSAGVEKKNVEICKCGVKKTTYEDKVIYGDHLVPISGRSLSLLSSRSSAFISS